MDLIIEIFVFQLLKKIFSFIRPIEYNLCWKRDQHTTGSDQKSPTL